MTEGYKPCDLCGSTIPDEPNELDDLRAEVERLRSEEASRLQLLDDAGRIENERDLYRAENTKIRAEAGEHRRGEEIMPNFDALVQTMRITAGHTASVVLMPHEALALVAEVERLRVEIEDLRARTTSSVLERAAIVAWLRARAAQGLTAENAEGAFLFSVTADRIEAGDHHATRRRYGK